MHRTPTLALLLDQQAATFRTQLHAVYDGAVDAIHDARVATRRIRELLALIPAVPGRELEDDTARSLKKIGRALGRVRDVDVQVALIANLEHHTTQAAPALVIVRQEYESERLAKTRKLIKTLERVEVDKVLEAVSDTHPFSLRKRLTSNGWRRQLQQLLVERARNAVQAINHAHGIYFPNRTHAARIGFKQLRYAAEIVDAIGLLDATKEIKALRKGQDILGDLHDRQTLATALQPFGKREEIKRAHVALAREVLEREVLQLHGDYLARRESLLDACRAIERSATRPRYARPDVLVGTAALAVSGLLVGRRMVSQT